MALNKSTGNMYSWLSETFNPIKGQCISHMCSYCFMHQDRLKPLRLDEKEFKTDLNQGKFIFVGSSTDMFAASVPDEWIFKVLGFCSMAHTKFLFQSKNPKRMHEVAWAFPKHSTLATTIETNRDMTTISKAPPAHGRAHFMQELHGMQFETTVTIEPIMSFDLREMLAIVKQCSPSWVSVGADSKGHNLPEPSASEVLALIHELEQFTKVERKKNLKRILEG
jgi:DNA repair photolyase